MFEIASPNLETLNLGRNPLSDGIPAEMAKAQSLKHLWLDDCGLTGSLPRALLNLRNLVTLRVPNNNITDLPIGGINRNIDEDDNDGTLNAVTPLKHLKILCLDRNRLGGGGDNGIDMEEKQGGGTSSASDSTMLSSSRKTVLPSNLAEWVPNLEELLLRHNQLSKLGVTEWPSALRILHVSSNRLIDLNELVPAVADADDTNENSPSSLPSSLTHLYANGNRLERLPKGVLSNHPKLQRLVISHNPPLKELPDEMWKELGLFSKDQEADTANGATHSSSCEILWQPNSNLKPPLRYGNSNADGDGSREEIMQE